MTGKARIRVVVLYAHPLLGEGLASMLSTRAEVDAVAVPGRDGRARRAALEERPDLVIVEQTGPQRPFESTGSLPVVFLRVEGARQRPVGQPMADPETIVALARQLSAARD